MLRNLEILPDHLRQEKPTFINYTQKQLQFKDLIANLIPDISI